MKFKDYTYNKISNINESDSFLAFFNDLKNYAILNSKYPKLYRAKKEIETQKEVLSAKNEYELSKDIEEWDAEMQSNIKKKLAQVPREKRAAQRDSFEVQIEKQRDMAKDKLKAKYTADEKRFDAKIAEIDDALDKLGELKLETNYLSKIWQRSKTEYEITIDQESTEKQAEYLMKLAEETERESFAKQAETKKRNAIAYAKEKREKLKELENEAKNAANDWKQKQSDNPEAAETLSNVQKFQTEIQRYLAKGKEIAKAMGDVDESVKFNYLFNINEDEKEEKEQHVKKLKKELGEIRDNIQDLLDKITPAKLKKVLDIDISDAEDKVESMKDQWEEVQDQYNEYREDTEIEEPVNNHDDSSEEDIEDEKDSTDETTEEDNDEPQKSDSSSSKNDTDGTDKEKSKGPEAESKKTSAEADNKNKSEDSDKEDDYKTTELKKKIKGAEDALQKKKEDGASSEIIAKIQTNIDSLKKKLNSTDNNSLFYDYITESINNIYNDIQKISTRIVPSFETYLKKYG